GCYRAAAPRADCSNLRTAAIPGPNSRAIRGCRTVSSARSAWPSRPRIPAASTPWWKPTTAACSAQTTPAPPGPKSTKTASCASASVNGGLTWTAQNYPTAQLYHIAITKDDPYQVCGAQQDNSSVCVPSDGGIDSRDLSGTPGNKFYAVARAEAGYVATHPHN